METAAIISAVAAAVKAAVDLTPSVIKTVQDATPFAQAIVATIKGENITQDQLDQLEAQITTLSLQLQAPLPADDGTTTT
jgi:hypothetical protein